MKRLPNQRKVKIDKPILKDLDHFAYYDRNALAEACKTLNGSEFKLWVYLLAQSPDIRWVISPSAISNEFGIPESTYHRAIKGLYKKGYLDEKTVYMNSQKNRTQNESNSTKMRDKSSQNDDRNKIINNTANIHYKFLNTSVEKFGKQPKVENTIFSELAF